MNVVFIPVRGDSKSIPFKNIKEIAGHPLVYWVTKASSDCECVDRVYVASDNERIKDMVESFGLAKVVVIGRSADTATDTASTESAMLEFAQNYDFDNIALVQATSPLLTSEDLYRGFELLQQEEIDSVLSVVEQKRFNWKRNGLNVVEPTNYNVFNRPRRQEFDGYLVENGAFYITSKDCLLETKCRLSGRIGGVEMPLASYFEIDEPDDWWVVEQYLNRRIEHGNNEGT